MADTKLISIQCDVDGLRAERACEWLMDGFAQASTAQLVRGPVAADMTVRLWKIDPTGFNISVTTSTENIPDIRMGLRDARLSASKVGRFVAGLVENLDAFAPYR